MDKAEIKEHITWACDCMSRHIQENCLNAEISNYLFVVIRLNEENHSFHFREFIEYIKVNNFKLSDSCDLCEQIDKEQSSLTWIDFTPYKIEGNTLISMCKLVPFGICENEIDFHVVFDRFRHYPIHGQKYDLNYFWQVSDKDFQKREAQFCKQGMKILRKHTRQKWFAQLIYKCFGKKMKILNLDEEMKKINVFS